MPSKGRVAEGGPVTATKWNAAHTVGTPVTYWPMARAGDGKPSRTRSEAWELGEKPGDNVVVAVEDHAGGIAISHVECNADCAVCQTAMQEFVHRVKVLARQRR